MSKDSNQNRRKSSPAEIWDINTIFGVCHLHLTFYAFHDTLEAAICKSWHALVYVVSVVNWFGYYTWHNNYAIIANIKLLLYINADSYRQIVFEKSNLSPVLYPKVKIVMAAMYILFVLQPIILKPGRQTLPPLVTLPSSQWVRLPPHQGGAKKVKRVFSIIDYYTLQCGKVPIGKYE